MGKVVLLNWADDNSQYENADLFKSSDLKNYNIALFDPLNFAARHNLRENTRDISSSEYKKLDKDEFMRLMANYKRVTHQLRMFLDNNGIFVVRSNIPNSYIQIRKYAAQGTQKFTESVLPVFFWLEEFIGKFSFLYRLCNKIEFVDYNNAFYRNFHKAPISAWQSHDIIPQGEVTVLARCGSQSSVPLLTKVSLKPGNGEIFFIPQLNITDETKQLVATFEEIIYELKLGLFKPSWLNKYEKEMDLNNPYKNEIAEIDQKIDLLSKRKLVLVKRENKIKECTGLLASAGEELASLVKYSFELLGFECSEKTKWLSDDKVSMCLVKNGNVEAIVQVTDTEKGALPHSVFESLIEIQGMDKFEKKPKMILISNSDRLNPPELRAPAFENDTIEASQKLEYCLIPSVELFEAVGYLWFKSKDHLFDTIKTSLRKDIMNCVGEFIVDERKYLIKKTVSSSRAVPA